MNGRKTGVVANFKTASEGFLEAMRNDLALDCSLGDLKYIQSIFRSVQRSPSVTEIFFCVDALKKGSDLPDSDVIAGLESDDPALISLFQRLTGDYLRYYGTTDRIPFVKLAEFAATGGILCECGHTLTISKSRMPESAPPSSETPALFSAGGDDGFLLLSSGRDPGNDFSGSAGVLLYPPRGSDIADYLKSVPSVMSAISGSVQPSAFLRMTDRGLIRDLAEIFAGADIDIDALARITSSDPSPELLNLPLAPAVAVILPESMAAEASAEAGKFGIGSVTLLKNLGKNGGFSINASPDVFAVSADVIDSLRYSKARSAKATALGDPVAVTVDVFSDRSADISALKLEGWRYETLKRLSDSGALLCICGTINPSGTEAIPLTVVLDAWRRECSPKIAACRFYPGKSDSMTVFILGAAGRPAQLSTRASNPGRETVWYSEKDKASLNSGVFFSAGKGSPAKQNAESDIASDLPGRGRIFSDISELCGSTPLLKSRLDLPARLLYKLEQFNPAGSTKDRVALSMLNSAIETGRLKPGGTVIEPTSGNTGIGLAAYGRHMGFRVIIVMPDSMSAERVSLIRAYGAQIVLTPGEKGMSGSLAEAERLRDSIPGAVILSQFDNSANPFAHFLTTGPEIWKDTEGQVDILVAGIGTGGTLCGTARYLKQMNPELIVVGCEPASSPLIGKGYAGKHGIAGIGADFIPANFDRTLVDIIAEVSDEEAREETRRLASETGLLTGISSGCAAFKARKLAELPENEGKTVVAILPDTGEHYLSTGLFD